MDTSQKIRDSFKTAYVMKLDRIANDYNDLKQFGKELGKDKQTIIREMIDNIHNQTMDNIINEILNPKG
jgi:hypothetical protein